MNLSKGTADGEAWFIESSGESRWKEGSAIAGPTA